jgi:heme-degrading monooxygenase HmoA
VSVCFIVQAKVKAGSEDEFLRRFDDLRRRIALGLDGHVVHNLCRSMDDPSRWMILAMWETASAAEAWERSPEHRELIMPMRACWEEVQRTRYDIQVDARRHGTAEQPA